ncbi:MAG: hypothetical protein B6247_31505 [Candidatus Parabeggiatoa sp. nov. 2]|nr:MAG: hypothetical protein B6247_31505 [Beggiatoa sp. 4572_84]
MELLSCYPEFFRYSASMKRIDQELQDFDTKTEKVQEQILALKKYLLNQDERLFNALVLAVYDGEPKWIEVELHYKNEYFFNIGFLDFTGDEKIFPIFDQPRVEAIKDALKENPNLSSEKVPVIFIGHNNTEEGISKRLFIHLNKMSQPTSS